MGTRLSVWPEGRMNEEVGDDHKLYFYQGVYACYKVIQQKINDLRGYEK